MSLPFILLVFLAVNWAGAPQQPGTNLTLTSAMKMLYPEYDAARKVYVWANPQIPDGLCSFDFYSTPRLLVTAEKLWQTEDDGMVKAYVVSSARPDDPSWGAHPDAPLIGVAVFGMDRGNWRVEVHTPGLGCFGTLGDPAPLSLVRWADKGQALRIDPGFTNMGETISDTLLFALIKGSFRKILQLRQSHYDDCDGSVPECSQTNSTLQFVPKAGSPYYDLQIITIEKAAGRTNSSTKVYRFDGDQYVVVP